MVNKIEVNVSALETTLNEIKNAYSGISNLMVLDENNQLLAKDQTTSDELVNQVSSSFELLLKRASIVGGIESLTFEGADQRIHFDRYENTYLATITSDELSQKEIAILTHILIPTILKVIQEVFTFKEAKNNLPPPIVPQISRIIEQLEPEIIEPVTPEVPAQFNPESAETVPVADVKPLQDNVIVSRFRVENLSGLSVVSDSPDAIRLDRALIGEWRERYGDKSIEEAYLSDAKSGKKVRCKFQSIKSSKLEGSGVVQVPHKLQMILGLKKGSLVLVKPVIEG